MNVLVTGGAGYIGAHVVRLLRERGNFVVIVDDLSTGVAERVGDAPVVVVDLASSDAVNILLSTLRKYKIDTVVHLAARKQVGESVARPALYYQQNVGALANLLIAMETAGIRRFLFSSSAAVYSSSSVPVSEESATAPISPYGETKLVGEWLTRDATEAWPLTAVSLRYFNVAGTGAPDLGDTAILNLIPMVMEKLRAGDPPVIFGADYPTADGTCIRDYIHVQDVAEAHLAAIDGIDALSVGHHVFNLGTGVGVSVLEIINAVQATANVNVSPIVVDRRAGDAAFVVAAVDRVSRDLGWQARFGLDEIVRSAWESRRD